MKTLCLVLLTLAVTDAAVQFSYSTLYDIHDFVGVKEVTLPRCSSGCLIFASTGGKKENAFMKNLLVRDLSSNTDRSIADLAAKLQPGTLQKVPLDLISGRYSIINNNPASESGEDVAVWIIDKSRAAASDYEIYEATAMSRRAAAIPKTVVTIMSASPFVVKAAKGDNAYTARLTGFDNALDANPDACMYAYKSNSLEAFEFHVNAPLISFVFSKKNGVTLTANDQYLNLRNLASGFVNSAGYNGCARVQGQKAYRSKSLYYSDEFDLNSKQSFNVSVEAEYDLAAGSQIVVKDMTNSKRVAITGANGKQQLSFPATKFINTYWDGIAPPQGFIMRLTAVKA